MRQAIDMCGCNESSLDKFINPTETAVHVGMASMPDMLMKLRFTSSEVLEYLAMMRDVYIVLF